MSRFAKFSLLVFIVSLLLFVLSFNEKIATVLNDGVCSRVRILMSRLTGVIGFSVFELLVLCAPLIIFGLIYYVVKTGKIMNVISGFLLPVSLYFLNLGIAYNAKTDLSLDGKITDAELIDTAYVLLDRVNSFDSDVPERVSPAFKGIRVKEIAASPILMRHGILGFYSFVSSEANVNNIMPDYKYYFTAFHEISHVLGYAREGEASLFAYLSLKDTGEEYFSFCAELYALEELMLDVYKISKTEYERLYGGLGTYAREQLSEYRSLLKKYPQSEFSSMLNSAHLSLWDGGGYSDFSRLVVLYNRVK